MALNMIICALKCESSYGLAMHVTGPHWQIFKSDLNIYHVLHLVEVPQCVTFGRGYLKVYHVLHLVHVTKISKIL